MSRPKMLQIGKTIRFNRTCRVGYGARGSDERVIIRTRIERAGNWKDGIGVVCGVRVKYLGRYIEATSRSQYCADGDDFDVACLAGAKRVLLYEVRTKSLTQQPLLVHPDDILVGHFIPSEFPLPTYHTTPYPMDNKYKAMLREEANKMPRDSKGRFTA